ncbi:DNA mismatch repair protein Msh6 [Episyrphus balteatus]|uniref:DNA mismatch repair protein Msh6 n=1 Tax=Episyrphus balteatus TaxID=286459 RepID=UPI0024868337|nr:DNA mismatch repair protein Msh6 [Episyrphus balteatus]
MDSKGDDSGSDTLDQSLQKKCVVADDDSSTSKKQPDAAVSEKNAADAPTTEPGGINMSDPKDSPASPSPPPPPTTTQLLSSSPTTIINISENNILQVESAAVAVATATADGDLIVARNNDNTTTSSSSSSNSNSKEDSRGFESKVRQISDDLKDTTLADENSLEKVVVDGQQQKDSLVTPSSDETVVATAATATTCVDIKNDSDGYDSDRTITYESPSKKSSSSSDKKKLKKITKKVRFKYNQHGKVCPDEGDDEDDDDEDTLNEGGRSKSILDPSQFPLSFESAHDEDDDVVNDDGSGVLQLVAGDADLVDDDELPPEEGGVQSILGKVSQMGKIEYLFRWVDKPGVQWENEEVLKEICPNLIKLYEEQRAKEREQDMHFAVRRKKTRQGLRNV